MKKTALCFTALAFLSLLAFTQEDGYYSDSFARLTYVKGHVVVQRAGDLGSEEGVVNLALVEGDQLETGDGRAELSFGRKNFLRLDSGTLVELSNMPRQDDNRVRLHLLKGNVYLRLNFLEEEKTFELHTPDASFYALEEGLYRFDMRGNAETELSVLEGSMEAAGEGGSQLIGSREKLIAANGQLGSHSNLSYGRDDFDNWNADRDALHSQYVS
ncbi:MAG: FecR domain-containing protein, partial [Candidatus Aminicenantales bacterium]